MSRIGSTLESLFDELGEREEFEALAARKRAAYAQELAQKEALAQCLQTAMQKENVSKKELAARMMTSRTCVYRLLDPGNVDISFSTVIRAFQAVNVVLFDQNFPRGPGRAHHRLTKHPLSRAKKAALASPRNRSREIDQRVR